MWSEIGIQKYSDAKKLARYDKCDKSRKIC